MTSFSIFRHLKNSRKIFSLVWILLKILWKMEHLLQKSKCSIFNNILNMWYFKGVIMECRVKSNVSEIMIFITYAVNKRHYASPFILSRVSSTIIYGPCCDIACLRGFRQIETQPSLRDFWQIETQTSLISYGDYLENWNFPCCKFRYDTFHEANNKGAD